MWQDITAGLIVAACAVHAGTRYMPLAWRQQLVYALSRRGLNQARLAKWFKTESTCGSGCGSCGAASSPSATSACGSGGHGGSDASAPAPSSPTTHRVIRLHVQR